MRRLRRFCLTMAAAVMPLTAAGAQDSAASAAPSEVSASAADSVLEERTTELASRLRCPVCQGESLQDSPSQLAQQMRDVVKEQLRAGRSPEEIEAYFVARYGEWILLEPTMKGLNKALYAFPVVLILGGLALVVLLVRRWTAAPAGAADGAAEAPADADSLSEVR